LERVLHKDIQDLEKGENNKDVDAKHVQDKNVNGRILPDKNMTQLFSI
jgi:hypothetical protein